MAKYILEKLAYKFDQDRIEVFCLFIQFLLFDKITELIYDCEIDVKISAI